MKKILLLILVAMSSVALNAQCDIDVTVSSAGWGDQTTWTLTDASGDTVLQGGTFGNGYSDNQVHTSANAPYTFDIYVATNTFADQFPDYVVTVDGVVDISGTATGIESGGTFSSPVTSCPPPICDIDVTVSSAGWGDQTTWTLTDTNGDTVLQGGTFGNGYSDNQVHTTVNPPYTFDIYVATNTFADQFPDYLVTVGGSVDISGTATGIESGGTFSSPVMACPSCGSPTAVVASAISSDSAILSWTGNLDALDYNWEIQPFGVSQGTAGPIAFGNALVDTFVSSGTVLAGATTYTFFVETNCGGTQSSFASVDFTTPCVALTAPYSQNFDAALTTPICWTNATGGESWSFQVSGGSGPGYGVAGSVDHTSGSGNFAWIDASGGIGANELISADIDISALAFPVAGFWIKSNNTDNGAQNSIELSYWDGAAWVSMSTYSGNNAAWVEVSDTVPSAAPAVTKFRLVQIESTTGLGNAFNNDLLVDDFFVHEAPTCPGVSNFEVDSLATDLAVLSWTENGPALEWFVSIVPSGLMPGAGTLVNTNPYTASGLASNTEYDFYVRSYCGPADSSFVFNGGSFTTSPECGDTVGGLIYSLTSTAEVLVNFQGTPGDYVSLEFLAGAVEACCDEVLIYDGLNGTGNILYGALIGGGLSDYSAEGTFESQTGMISLVVNSDVSATAETNGYTPFEVVLSCYPPPPFEIGVTAILSPVSACGQAVTPVQIVVENFGSDSIFYAPVVVELTGDINDVYTLVIDSLPIGAIDTIDLAVLNTLAGGTVTFTAFTNLASDQDTSNDTTEVTVVFGAVPVAPVIANVTACEGDTAVIGFASLGALSWFESATSSSPFFEGDTLMHSATNDTTFYVSQQETFGGTFTIDLFDSFGDGWNGGSLEVIVNGLGVLNSPFTLITGTVGQETFTAAHGDSLTLIFTAGSFIGEVSYQISDPQGNLIFEDGFTGNVATGTVYNDEIFAAGCPSGLSMVTVNVNPNYLDTVVMSACDSMMIAGVYQTTSGFYTDSLTSVSTCDSIVVFDLTINASSEESVSVTICDAVSYTLPDGAVVNTAGAYTSTLISVTGCDSVINTDLSVVSSYNLTQNVQVCADDSLAVGTSSYNATGTYTDTLSSVGNCDSVVTTNLVVYSAIDVTLGGVSIVCDNADVLDLTLSPAGGTLSGPGVVDTASFDASVAGVGSHVLVYTFTDDNACSGTASLNVDVVVCTGIDNIKGIETISIYPNPYVSTLNIMFDDAISGELSIKLFDVTGRVLMTKDVNTTVGVNNISLDVPADIAAGVNLLQIERDGAVYSTTLIKK